jgi:cellulose biosynthesis protein BcsQ
LIVKAPKRQELQNEDLMAEKKFYSGKKKRHTLKSQIISECAGFGQTIFEFAPNSPGAKDHQRIVQSIINYEN